MAPIASKLLDFITNLAGFIAKLFETHPAIAQVAGVMGILGGVFWALMAPIVAISSVLTNVFGLSLFSVTEKILDFVRTSSLVTGATEALIGAFGSISAPILAVVAVIGAFIASSFIYGKQTRTLEILLLKRGTVLKRQFLVRFKV